MSCNKIRNLSLSKKLDGGYLNVKKRASNMKQRVKKGGYQEYLQKHNNSLNKVGGGSNKRGDSKDSKHKVVAIKLKNSPNKQRKPKQLKKEVKEVKGIPDILPKKQDHVPKAVPKPVPKAVPKPVPKAVPKAVSKPVPKNPVKQRGVPIKMPITGGNQKKRSVTRSNSRRTNTRRKSSKRKHDLKKGKRISVTKTRKYSDKDISKIQEKLKSIKQKSTHQIKEELNKQGVHLTGKSPSILKDIYMYSQLCGINIRRE